MAKVGCLGDPEQSRRLTWHCLDSLLTKAVSGGEPAVPTFWPLHGWCLYPSSDCEAPSSEWTPLPAFVFLAALWPGWTLWAMARPFLWGLKTEAEGQEGTRTWAPAWGLCADPSRTHFGFTRE